MVKCSSCGKEIDRIPNWMESIKVEYVCNNCPNRTMKNIAFMSLEPMGGAKPAEAVGEEPVIEGEEEAEEEDL